MGECFGVIFQMSLAASVVIAAVLLIRLLLVHAPRRYSYVLWLVVLIRLVCPVVPTARFGVVPDMERMFGAWLTKGETTEVPYVPASASEDLQISGKELDNGVLFDGHTGEQEMIGGPDDRNKLEDEYDRGDVLSGEAGRAVGMRDTPNTGQSTGWISKAAWNVVGWCWLCGCVIFLSYGITDYLRLRFRMRRKEMHWISMGRHGDIKERNMVAVLQHRRVRILEDSGIGAPFTIGIFRPVICLPKGMPADQRELVIVHEDMHIQRRDNLLKLLAYAARCLHWFNPLAWLWFCWFEEDMETSCDEAVLRKLGYERRKDYANALLALAECGRDCAGFYPVSFGRKNAKARIKNVLSAKKAGLWAALASAAVVAVASAVLLVNHKPVETVQEPAANTQDNPDSAVDEPAADIWVNLNLVDSEMIEDRLLELRHQEELQELLKQLQGEMEAKENEMAAQLAENAEWEAEINALQELIRVLETEMQIEEKLWTLQAMIENGKISAKEVRLMESGLCLDYGDSAVMINWLDEACDLLSNPNTGFGENEVPIEYSLPLNGFADGSVRISSTYGVRVHPVSGELSFHSGIDFTAEKGTPVYAAADACVYLTGFDEESGNYVILIHANGELTYYTHCESIEVQAGDLVERGQQIAAVGNTGNSTGPHLHFAVSRQGAFVSPTFITEGELTLSFMSCIEWYTEESDTQ